MEHYPFSGLLFLLSESCLLASTIFRAKSPRWTLFCVLLITNVYLTFATTGNAVPDYFIGSILVARVLAIADYGLITDIHRDFRVGGQKTAIPDTAPLSQRFGWGLSLCLAPRGVGWEHEPKGIFRARFSPNTPKSRFLARQLASLGYYVLLLDAASIYNRATPVFCVGCPPIASRPLFWRFIDLYSFAGAQYASQSLLQCLISIISVSINYSRPQDWVAAFGYWGDAYTLRRFWGRTWHQFLRRIFSTQGRLLARTLGLQKGTNASSYVQLYTAFALSGVLHFVADYKMHRSLTPGGSLVFFTIQAVAITLEDFVLFLARKLGVKPAAWWTFAGYAWVSVWFVSVYSQWVSPIVAGGLMEDSLNLRVSIILGVLRGQWDQTK
ncbi:membrane bound O-acyl transferase family-domain-containing protein [Mycena rebaudengoi]|nr:membrane bound O-acyl transferase family-domain-containing protein [Mycena rebaudengoi]